MLNSEQINQFHQTGFLKIPKVFQGKELKLLQKAAEKAEADGLAHADEHHLYRKLPDGSKAYFRSENMWNRDPIFRASTVHPKLLAALGQCIGHPFLPWNDSLVSKQPQTQTPIKFHQDPPYFKLENDVTFGVPDFVTDIYLKHSTIANGCVHGIPGRHLVGTIDLKEYTEDELFDDCGAIPMEMEPGDVLFHALSAPHGSRANLTDTTRTTFYLKFNAQEIEDWKGDGTRNMSYDAAGIAKVQSFIEQRREMGFDTDLGSDLSLEDNGFTWKGAPATPPWHWKTLAEKYTEAEKTELRQLRQTAQQSVAAS